MVRNSHYFAQVSKIVCQQFIFKSLYNVQHITQNNHCLSSQRSQQFSQNQTQDYDVFAWLNILIRNFHQNKVKLQHFRILLIIKLELLFTTSNDKRYVMNYENLTYQIKYLTN